MKSLFGWLDPGAFGRVQTILVGLPARFRDWEQSLAGFAKEYLVPVESAPDVPRRPLVASGVISEAEWVEVGRRRIVPCNSLAGALASVLPAVRGAASGEARA